MAIGESSHQLMPRNQNPLTLDPEVTARAITNFIQDQFVKSKREAVLIGLSGGLDSAVVAYLCVKSLGKDFVRLLNMPERDSKGIHQKDARLIARELGVQLEVRDLTAVLKALGVYSSLPIGMLPTRNLKQWLVKFGRKLSGLENETDVLTQRLQPKPNSLVAKGNAYASAKHRMRMLMLYHLADTHNLFVAGAANKTEWLTGTFSKWGCDQCADIMPILHLYRSQLPGVARYLGIPESIRTKAADPDVMPGIDDKEKLLGSFELIDQILSSFEKGIEKGEIERQFGKINADFAATLLENSRHMRESPYALAIASL